MPKMFITREVSSIFRATTSKRPGTLFICRFSSSSTAIPKNPADVEPTAKKWQLMAAVCLERCPLIAPPSTELEVRYKEMLKKMEDEGSLLSFHELRRMQEAKMAKKGTIESDDRQLGTAQDFEDASVAERKRFTPAPRFSETEDANEKSVNRLLDKKLIFLVPSPYTAGSWRLPTTLLRNGETLAQAAERCLGEYLEISPAATFYGNAPRKLYKYTYPKPIKGKTGADGAKVFIFKAELSRQAKITPAQEQFRWLNRNEINGTTIFNKHYLQCVRSFVFE